MRKIFDALLWAGAGSMLTFYALTQAMRGFLAPDGVSLVEANAAREQFWNLWWWAVGTMIVIGVADILLRWRSGELSR